MNRRMIEVDGNQVVIDTTSVQRCSCNCRACPRILHCRELITAQQYGEARTRREHLAERLTKELNT